MSLQKSKLITRKQLACLTGGKIGNFQNPLHVGTPMNFCGGRSLAMSHGQIHHICIKEDKNELPSSTDEEFVLYRIQKRKGELPSDIALLLQKWKNHPSIPMFWEPNDQSGLSLRVKGVTNALGVFYVGHWRVIRMETFADRPVMYLGYNRCAIIVLRFHRLEEEWLRIIDECHDKTVEEIVAWNETRINYEKKGGVSDAKPISMQGTGGNEVDNTIDRTSTISKPTEIIVQCNIDRSGDVEQQTTDMTTGKSLSSEGSEYHCNRGNDTAKSSSRGGNEYRCNHDWSNHREDDPSSSSKCEGDDVISGSFGSSNFGSQKSGVSNRSLCRTPNENDIILNTNNAKYLSLLQEKGDAITTEEEAERMAKSVIDEVYNGGGRILRLTEGESSYNLVSREWTCKRLKPDLLQERRERGESGGEVEEKKSTSDANTLKDVSEWSIGQGETIPLRNDSKEYGPNDLVIHLTDSKYLRMIKKYANKMNCADDASNAVEEMHREINEVGGRFLDRILVDGKCWYSKKKYPWACNVIIAHLQQAWRIKCVDTAKARRSSMTQASCSQRNEGRHQTHRRSKANASPDPVGHNHYANSSQEDDHSKPSLKSDEQLARKIADQDRRLPRTRPKRAAAAHRTGNADQDQIESSKKLEPIEKIGQHIAVLLKDLGWTQKFRCIRGFDQYVHYKPGANIQTAVEGQDRITGYSKLAKWAYHDGFYEREMVGSDWGQEILKSMGIDDPSSIFETIHVAKRNSDTIQAPSTGHGYPPANALKTKRLKLAEDDIEQSFTSCVVDPEKSHLSNTDLGRREPGKSQMHTSTHEKKCGTTLEVPMKEVNVHADNPGASGSCSSFSCFHVHIAGNETDDVHPLPLLHDQQAHHLQSVVTPHVTQGSSNRNKSEADQFMDVFDEAEYFHFNAKKSNDNDSTSFYGHILEWLTKKAESNDMSLGKKKNMLRSLMVRFDHRKKRMKDAEIKFGGMTSPVHLKYLRHLINECKAELK